jgi:PAS domain S-box-containing protein
MHFRRALLFSLLVFSLTGIFWWRLSLTSQEHFLDARRDEIQGRLNGMGSSLTMAVNRRQALLTGLAAFVKLQRTEELVNQNFEIYASGLQGNDPVIRAVQVFPKDGYELVYPMVNNEILTERTLDDLLNDKRPNLRADVQRAIQSRKITLSQPYELLQGGQGVVARLAVYDGDEFWGLVVVVLNIDPLLAIPGINSPSSDLQYALKDSTGQVFFGDESVFISDPVLFRIPLLEDSWTLAAVPLEGWQANVQSQMTYFWLSGLLLAILLSGMVFLFARRQSYLAQTVQTQMHRLSESEEQLRLAMGASNIGFFNRDLSTGRIWFSPEYKQQIGYAEDELVDDLEEWKKRVHPDDLPGTLEKVHACTEGSTPEYEAEFRLQHKDGSYRWILARGLLQENTNSKSKHLVGCHIDITTQKQNEEALAASERLFRVLTESMKDVVWILDTETMQFRYISPSVEKLSGYTPEEILVLPGADLLLPETRQHYVDLIQKRANAVLTGKELPNRFFSEEIEQLCKDGTSVWTEIVATYYVNSETGHVEMRGVTRDISERKQAEEKMQAAQQELQLLLAEAERSRLALVKLVEEQRKADEQIRQLNAALEERVQNRTAQLEAANKALQEAVRVRNDFLANMSHELRTPLTSILGMSELLEEQVRGPLNENQLHYVKSIYTSGDHLLKLINDVLDLSKIEAKQMQIDWQPVIIEDLCQASLGFVRKLADDKRLQIRFSMHTVHAAFEGDPRRIKQCLINLLNNAVKFTPEDGQVGLEVQDSVDGQGVQFTVWDTGIGIPPEEQQRLFQPFVQLDSSLSRRYEGSGLGLVLVARFIEMHNGSIELQSEPGKGTRVTFVLPYGK